MNWFVVTTQPRQEALSEQNLARIGVEVFSPRIRQERVIRRKRQSVSAPLFPGYLFARFNLDTHFRYVQYTHGVRGLVTFGACPAVMEDDVIESIRSRLLEGVLVVKPSSFRPGETVRIETGPFRGLKAIFEREMSDQQRVVVLLRMLSCHARVTVGLDQIELVHS